MGQLEMTLPEMLNTIADGARNVKDAWQKENKEEAWEAYSRDMKEVVSTVPWDPSRYSTEVKNLMEKISHSIQDELLGSLYNEDNVQRLSQILSDIIQLVNDCRLVLSNTKF